MAGAVFQGRFRVFASHSCDENDGMMTYTTILPSRVVLLQARQAPSLPAGGTALAPRFARGVKAPWCVGMLPLLEQHLQEVEEAAVAGLNSNLGPLEAGVRALVDAAIEGDQDTALRLVTARPQLVDGRDVEFFDRTALMMAAKGGHEALVRLLLDFGASLDLVNANGCSALYWACFAQHQHRCFGFSGGKRDGGGHEAVVEALLQRGADPSLRTACGRSALMAAAANGHLRLVRMLLRHYVRVEGSAKRAVEETDDYGNTALHRACQNGHGEVVMCLVLEGGAGWSRVDVQGRTPRDAALSGGHTRCTQALDWCAGESERACLLHQARTTHDVTSLRPEPPTQHTHCTLLPIYALPPQPPCPSPRSSLQCVSVGGLKRRGRGCVPCLPKRLRALAREGRDQWTHSTTPPHSPQHSDLPLLVPEGGEGEGSEEERGATLSFVITQLTKELYTELLAAMTLTP